MILQETVMVTLNSANIKHYESLGYVIPYYVEKWNKRLSIKRGTYINVKVKDLLPTSSVKILCQCDYCKSHKFLKMSNYTNNEMFKNHKLYLCKQCAMNFYDVKQKLSKSHIGKCLSEKTRQKLSLAKSGKNNPNYNLKLTDEDRQNKRTQITTWKNQVKNRDKYICQKCGYIGKKNDGIMEAHHINNYKNFKNQRLYIDNGLTLCFECHRAKNNKSIHNIYGIYPSPDQYKKFMQE
jgi:hypothetical protein